MVILMLYCAFVSFIEIVRRQILNKPGWLIQKNSISQASFICLICWSLCVSAAQAQMNFYTWRFFWRKKNPTNFRLVFPDTVRSNRKNTLGIKQKFQSISSCLQQTSTLCHGITINSSVLWDAAPSCTGKSSSSLPHFLGDSEHSALSRQRERGQEGSNRVSVSQAPPQLSLLHFCHSSCFCLSLGFLLFLY